MNLATVIVLGIVLALVMLAISVLRKGKENDCHGVHGKCASCHLECPLKGNQGLRHCKER